MYSYYGRGNDDELDSGGMGALGRKDTPVVPRSRPVVSPADCSSNDTTTVLHVRRWARKAREQPPFHILLAYLHLDDVP